MPRAGVDEVRLTAEEREGILGAAVRACHETSVSWRRIILFGSRARPEARGGDIDLLLEILPTTDANLRRLVQRWRFALEDELGEQKFDLVLDDGLQKNPFIELARANGVELWIND